MEQLEHSLVPGPIVRLVNDLSVGDLLFEGSETNIGTPNIVRVLSLRNMPGGFNGFDGRFVLPVDPAQKRLPDDQDFFTWDFVLAKGHHRRALPKQPLAPRRRLSVLAD